MSEIVLNGTHRGVRYVIRRLDHAVHSYYTAYCEVEDSRGLSEIADDLPDNISFIGKLEFVEAEGTDFYGMDCLGIDMAHYWNFCDDTNLDIAETEREIFSVIDWYLEFGRKNED